MRAGLGRHPFARSLRRAVLTGIDGVEEALVLRDPFRPPRRLADGDAARYRDVGTALVEQAIQLAGLRPHHRVLDIGCGPGRVAVPLMRYLHPGSYEGFDVSADVIDWCRETIGSVFPRFGFSLVDVANTHYNPRGREAADTVRFPYEARAFDFVIATSLFAHMLPAGFANYARESARTLVPGGTLFATFLLVDEDGHERIELGETDVDLAHRLHDPVTGADYRVMEPRSPEATVGLDATFVTRTLERAGFTITALHPGRWTGRADALTFADLVIARREPFGYRGRLAHWSDAGG